MKKHFLETVKWGSFLLPIVGYRGVEVMKTPTGYRVLRQNVKTPKEVDVVINSATQTLKNSIQ